MKVQHPNTKTTLLMNEHCLFIAEIDKDLSDTSDDVYESVEIGVIGYSGSLHIDRDAWEGFKALVAEIDREWT